MFRNLRLSYIALSGLLCLPMGCGASDDTGQELLPGLMVPEVPQNGFQVITPIVRDIVSGSDMEVCTWTDLILDRDVDVRSLVGYQTLAGHHSILFYTLNHQPLGTQRVCNEDDMASFRYVAASAGSGIEAVAPGDLVYRIPAGAQIVINHHYLNASDQTMDGQSLMNVVFAEPGAEHTRSGATTMLSLDLVVPPGESTHVESCVVEHTLKLWFLYPHLHRWGTTARVDVTQGDQTTRLADVTWEPYYTYDPPKNLWEPSEPFVLSPGDEISIECAWDNDTGQNLPFGMEMCVIFGQFVDDQNIGNWACVDGTWQPF